MSESKAMILGCAGKELTTEEVRFYGDERPWGFILFARNIGEPAQIADLVAAMRQSVGRPDAPVFIDQEGGRVQRLRPPVAPNYPAGAALGALYRSDREAGLRAAWLMSRLHAFDLSRFGITADCLPVLDVPIEGASDVIGTRAYGKEPKSVLELGRAAAEGLMAGGVLPIMKHVPGHGRAFSDSHLELPTLDTPLADLREHDFVPFKALKDLPMAMTAHVVYEAIDPERCATLSSRLVHHVIRGEIGFDGLLMSDDVGMHALSGGFDERTHRALVAGCDVALHCSGKLDEMQECAKGSRALDGDAARRAAAALDRITPPSDFDAPRGAERLAHLLSGGTAIA